MICCQCRFQEKRLAGKLIKLKFLGCHPLVALITKIIIALRFQFKEIKECYFQTEVAFLVLEMCIL